MYATEISDIQMLFLNHIFRCETKEKPSIATYIPWVLEDTSQLRMISVKYTPILTFVYTNCEEKI